MKTKLWLKVAVSFTLIGCILFVGVMTSLRWDFSKLSTVKYKTNTYEISEDFENISLNTYTTDVVFKLSDDEKCKVECFEKLSEKHSVSVKENTLSIEVKDRKFTFFELDFNSPKITVYLSKTEYNSLYIKATTGDIEIPKEFTFKNADISVSTGDINFNATLKEGAKIKTTTGNVSVKNSSIKSLDISVSTGNVALNNVLVHEKISIQTTTGNVKLESCDSLDIFIKTSTGNVVGSLLSGKVFKTKTNTGSVKVPQNSNNGNCEIITSTGNIKISVI